MEEESAAGSPGAIEVPVVIDVQPAMAALEKLQNSIRETEELAAGLGEMQANLTVNVVNNGTQPSGDPNERTAPPPPVPSASAQAAAGQAEGGTAPQLSTIFTERVRAAIEAAFRTPFNVTLDIANLDSIRAQLGGSITLAPGTPAEPAAGSATASTTTQPPVPGINPVIESQLRREYNAVTRAFVSAISRRTEVTVKRTSPGGHTIEDNRDVVGAAGIVATNAKAGTYEGLYPGWRVSSTEPVEQVFEVLRRVAPGLASMPQGAVSPESLAPDWDKLPLEIKSAVETGKAWLNRGFIDNLRQNPKAPVDREAVLADLFGTQQAPPLETPPQPATVAATATPPSASNVAAGTPPSAPEPEAAPTPTTTTSPIYASPELAAARKAAKDERQAQADSEQWVTKTPDEWARSMLLRVAPLSIPNEYPITDFLAQNPELRDRIEQRGQELGIGRSRQEWQTGFVASEMVRPGSASVQNPPIGRRGKTARITEPHGVHRDDMPAQMGTYADISWILASSPDLAAEVNSGIQSRSITQAIDKTPGLREEVSRAMGEGKFPDYISTLVNNKELADKVLSSLGIDQRAVVGQILAGVTSLPMVGMAKPSLENPTGKRDQSTRRGRRVQSGQIPIDDQQQAELQALIESTNFSASGDGPITRVRRPAFDGEQFGRFVEGGFVERLAAEKQKQDEAARARGETPQTAYDAAEFASFLSGGPMPPGLGGLLSAIGMGAFTDMGKIVGKKGDPTLFFEPQNDAQRALLPKKPGMTGRITIGGKTMSVERLGPTESAKEFVRQLFLDEFGGQGENANQQAAALAERLNGIGPWVARGNNPFSGEKRVGNIQGPNTVQDWARNVVQRTQVEEALGRIVEPSGFLDKEGIKPSDWQLIGGKPRSVPAAYQRTDALNEHGDRVTGSRTTLPEYLVMRLKEESRRLEDAGAETLPPPLEIKETTALGGLLFTYFQNASKIKKAIGAVDRTEKGLARTRERLDKLRDPGYISKLQESGLLGKDQLAEYQENLPNTIAMYERRIDRGEALLPKLTARRDELIASPVLSTNLDAISRAGGFDLAATEPGKRVNRMALAKALNNVMGQYIAKYRQSPAVVQREASANNREMVEKGENAEAFQTRPPAEEAYQQKLREDALEIVKGFGVTPYMEKLVERAREASDEESYSRFKGEYDDWLEFLDKQVARVEPENRSSDLRKAVKDVVNTYRYDGRSAGAIGDIFLTPFARSRDVEGRDVRRLRDEVAQERENAGARGSASSRRKLNERPTRSQVRQQEIASRAFKGVEKLSSQNVVDEFRAAAARASGQQIATFPSLEGLDPDKQGEALAQRAKIIENAASEQLKTLRYGLPNVEGDRQTIFGETEDGEPVLSYEQQFQRRRAEVRSDVGRDVRKRARDIYKEKTANRRLTKQGKLLAYYGIMAREGFRQGGVMVDIPGDPAHGREWMDSGIDALTTAALKADPEFQRISDEYEVKRQDILAQTEARLTERKPDTRVDLSEAATFRRLDSLRQAGIRMLGRYGVPVRSAVIYPSEEKLDKDPDKRAKYDRWMGKAVSFQGPDGTVIRGREPGIIQRWTDERLANTSAEELEANPSLRQAMLFSDSLANDIEWGPAAGTRGRRKVKYRSIAELKKALPDTVVGREARDLLDQLPAPDLLNTQGTVRPSSPGPGVATGADLASWARRSQIVSGVALNPGDEPTGAATAAAGGGRGRGRGGRNVAADGGANGGGNSANRSGDGGKFFIKEPLKVHVTNWPKSGWAAADGDPVAGGVGGGKTVGSREPGSTAYRIGKDLTPEQAIMLERGRIAQVNKPVSETYLQSQITAMQAQQAIAPRSLMTRMIERASNMFGGRDEELARIARLRDAATRFARLETGREGAAQKLGMAAADKEATASQMADLLGGRPEDSLTGDDASKYERLKKRYDKHSDAVEHLTKVVGLFDQELVKNTGEQVKLGDQAGKTGAILQNLAASVVGGVVGSLTTMGVAQAAKAVFEVGSMALGPTIERSTGNMATTARVQAGLGGAVAQSGGYSRAAVARELAQSGIGPTTAARLTPTLQGRAVGVAAGQQTTAQLDYIRSSSRIEEENRPYGGYDKSLFATTGGLGGTPILGQASVSEQLFDALRPLSEQPRTLPGKGRGSVDPQKMADADKTLKSFTEQVNRATGGLRVMTNAADKGSEANKALAKSADAAGNPGWAKLIRETGMTVSGFKGKTGAEFPALITQYGSQSIKLPASQLAQQMEGSLKAQRFTSLAQLNVARTTTIPQQFAMQQAFAPSVAAGRSPDEVLRAFTGGTGMSPSTPALGTIARSAETIRTRTNDGLDAAKELARAKLPVADAEAFAKSLDEARRIGNQIASLRFDTQVKQAAVSANQYKESLRQAKIAAQDARGMANMGTSPAYSTSGAFGNLGTLQRRDFQLGQQSAILSQGLSQRQINFQRAIAGFAAPGLTPEERAARIAQAKLEADYAQKQLNIQKQLTANQAKEFNITAQRNVVITANQVELMQESREAEKSAMENDTAIGLLTATLEQPMQEVQAGYTAALDEVNLKIGGMAGIIQNTSDGFENVTKAMDDMLPAIDQWAGALGIIDVVGQGKTPKPGSNPFTGGTIPVKPFTPTYSNPFVGGGKPSNVTVNVKVDKVGSKDDVDHLVREIGRKAAQAGLRF